MARPSKSEFEKWDPAVLGRQADTVRSILETVQKESGEADSQGKALGEHIRGQFGTALSEQMGVNTKSLQTLPESLNGLASAYTNAAQTLAAPMSALRQTEQLAIQNGFAISEDWQLQDSQRPGMRRSGIQEQLQHQLDGAVTALDQADEQAMGDIEKSTQALSNLPMPQLGLGQGSEPEPPKHDEPKPGEPKPEDKPHDQDQPKPGDTPQSDGPAIGPHGEHPDMLPDGTRGRHFAKVQALPNPGPGIDPSQSPDDQWRAALAQYKPGDPLPSPQSVKDPKLRMVAAMASQQGVAYSWGGGHDPKGPGPTNGSNEGVNGMDCSGAVRYAVSQAYGFDPGGLATNVGTPNMLSSPHYEQVSGPPQTGDIVVCEGGNHTAVCIGGGPPPMFIDASDRGQPLAPTKGWWGGDQQVLRPKT